MWRGAPVAFCVFECLCLSSSLRESRRAWWWFVHEVGWSSSGGFCSGATGGRVRFAVVTQSPAGALNYKPYASCCCCCFVKGHQTQAGAALRWGEPTAHMFCCRESEEISKMAREQYFVGGSFKSLSMCGIVHVPQGRAKKCEAPRGDGSCKSYVACSCS